MERILNCYRLLPSTDIANHEIHTFEDKSIMTFIDEGSDSSEFESESETDDETVPLLKPKMMKPANVLNVGLNVPDDGPIVPIDGTIEMMKLANVPDDGPNAPVEAPTVMMDLPNVPDGVPIEMMDTQTCPEDIIETPIIQIHVDQHCNNDCAVTSE